MSLFTGSHKSRRWDIESRIEALRDELASLSRDAARAGRNTYESTRETGHDLVAEFPRMSRAARRQARVAEQTVRDHPTAAVAVAGLVLIGLAASVIYSRR